MPNVSIVTPHHTLNAYLSLPRGTERLNRELGPEPSVDGVAAGYEQDRSGAAELLGLGHPVPDHCRHAAGTVAHRELQVFAAIAPAPQLDLPDQKGLRDLDSVCKFPNWHAVRR